MGIKNYLRRRAIKRWRKALALDESETIFQRLYQEVNGFALSKKARSNQDSLEYIYGEIEFESFIALLSLCNPNSSTVFYDLGSGTGKAVLACAMVFEVRKSYGIELFPSLHHCAQRQREYLERFPNYSDKARRIEFRLANLLESDFEDATIIFINATAFFGESWLAISKQVEEQVTPGTLIITTTKPLNSNRFNLIRATQVKMSWGIVRAFIQQYQSFL